MSIAPWALVTVVVISSSGSSLRNAACQAFHCFCSANHTFLRFPKVLTFAVTDLLTPVSVSPALSISALSCGSRPARGSLEAFSARNCLAYSVHSGADFPELLLNPREIPLVCNRFFQAGETIGQGSRQGDEVGKLRDRWRLFWRRSQGWRALRFLGGQLPGDRKSASSKTAWKRFCNENFIRRLHHFDS